MDRTPADSATARGAAIGLVLLAIILSARFAPANPFESTALERRPQPTAAISNQLQLGAVTIDSIKTGTFGGSTATYTAGGGLLTIGSANVFYLSDHTSYGSGAGYVPRYYSTLDHVEISGTGYHYFLRPPADSVIYFQVSFDPGVLSSQGTLTAAGPIVVTANRSSNVATIQGLARVRDNVCTRAGEPEFKYFSAEPGRVVPFISTLTNVSRPWTPGAFDSSFVYRMTTLVDLAHPLPPSGLLSLDVRGPATVGASSVTSYSAIARYAGDLRLDVSDSAAWSVVGPPGVTVNGGLLTVGAVPGHETSLELRASFGPSGGSVQETRSIRAFSNFAPVAADQWPMFQADAGHTGYRPVTLRPEWFATRWARAIAPIALNPVAAADGKVFCTLNIYGGSPGPTLFAIDAQSGATLWSRDFGARAVTSMNPPAYLDGDVYVQTVNNERDTWLWAFHAADGAVTFRVPHEAQWERYFAPTFFNHRVYVDGGYGGGMYGFDAYTGGTQWYTGKLPQYDEWTPAVDSVFAYAYLANGPPGLYAVHRVSGGIAYSIADPGAAPIGPSMHLAPVLGSMQDAIVVNSNRLLCFDLVTRTLRWSVTRSFGGQPSVAKGVIYAIDGGKLAAMDESSGTLLWGWQPPSGSLSGTMIVTDSHVLASTASTTFAVSLANRSAAWSHPSGGALALGNGSLYIATPFGSLTSIDLTRLITATTLLRFEAEGRAGAIAVKWRFADPAGAASVTVERAEDPDGPWTSLSSEAGAEGLDATLLDDDVAVGIQYWYRLGVRMRDGSQASFGPVAATAREAPRRTNFTSLGPVPANQELRIAWTLARGGRVSIRILDLQGRDVAVLVDGVREAGSHAATAAIPSRLTAGMYFVRMEADGQAATRRFAVVR